MQYFASALALISLTGMASATFRPLQRVQVCPTGPSDAEIPGYGSPGYDLQQAQCTDQSAPGYVSQPSAPLVYLSPALGSAFANVTAELPVGILTKAIPYDDVDRVVAGIFAAVNAKLEASVGVDAQLLGSLPQGLPSSYRPSPYGPEKPLNYDGGMSMANILDWCAYLSVRVWVGAGVQVRGSAYVGAGIGGNLGALVTLNVDASLGLGVGIGLGLKGVIGGIKGIIGGVLGGILGGVKGLVGVGIGAGLNGAAGVGAGLGGNANAGLGVNANAGVAANAGLGGNANAGLGGNANAGLGANANAGLGANVNAGVGADAGLGIGLGRPYWTRLHARALRA
jgi:hypothetical protein